MTIKGKNKPKLPSPSAYASVYYNVDSPSAFSGINRLKSAVPGATQRSTKNWLMGQESYTLHKQARRRLKKDSIVVTGIDDQWSIDLADVSSLAHDNDGVKFLLVAIDSLSRFAWVVPLKDKTGNSIEKAFKTIFQKGRVPRNVRSDRGREFLNKQMSSLLKQNEITHHIANHRNKAAFSERFIRTIKSKIYRYLRATGSDRYIDVLPKLVLGYNNTVHSTTNTKPADVTHYNAEKLWRKLYKKIYESVERRKGNLPQPIKKPNFRKGDRVILAKEKGLFAKGYTTYWTRENFIVNDILSGSLNQPYRYLIKDLEGNVIDGSFKSEELQRVREENRIVRKVVKNRTRTGVEWRGWPKGMIQWIQPS